MQFTPAVLLATALFTTSSGVAQAPTERCIDGAAGDWFGYSVANAGDVNADGFADTIAGSLLAQGAGTATVLSGRDGAVLHQFVGNAAGDNFGVSVSTAGDVDGDGHADVIVGAWLDDTMNMDAGMARVYSGRTGSVLHTFYGSDALDRFGGAVATAGDVDDDGYADIMVGATGSEAGVAEAGAVIVYSGRTGLPIHTLRGSSFQEYFGGALAPLGDVDGDGINDLIVGAWRDDTGARDAGSALVFSGATGHLIHTLAGDRPNANIGFSVANAGDLDGDGVDDVIAGGPEDDSIINDAGMVRIWSGASGRELRTIDGTGRDDHFGHAVAGMGDLDGDGVPDLAVGAPGVLVAGLLSGEVRVLSGATGAPLTTLSPATTLTNYGSSLAAGDANGDGFLDLAVGAYWDGQGGFFAGRVCLVDLGFTGVRPARLRYLGAACPGSGGRLPTIDLVRPPEIGMPLEVRLRGVVAGVSAALFLGDPSPPLPLDLIGVPGCTLNIAPFATVTGTIGASGRLTASFRLPAEPGLVGFSRDMQWVVTDPGASGALPLTTSNVARFVVGGDPTGVSPRGSNMTASPISGLVANGSTASALTVTLLDGLGMPVAGRTVEFRCGPGGTIVQPLQPTDPGGQASGTIVASQPGPLSITAVVDPGPNEIVVRRRLTLLFF